MSLSSFSTCNFCLLFKFLKPHWWIYVLRFWLVLRVFNWFNFRNILCNTYIFFGHCLDSFFEIQSFLLFYRSLQLFNSRFVGFFGILLALFCDLSQFLFHFLVFIYLQMFEFWFFFIDFLLFYGANDQVRLLLVPALLVLSVLQKEFLGWCICLYLDWNWETFAFGIQIQLFLFKIFCQKLSLSRWMKSQQLLFILQYQSFNSFFMILEKFSCVFLRLFWKLLLHFFRSWTFQFVLFSQFWWLLLHFVWRLWYFVFEFFFKNSLAFNVSFVQFFSVHDGALNCISRLLQRFELSACAFPKDSICISEIFLWIFRKELQFFWAFFSELRNCFFKFFNIVFLRLNSLPHFVVFRQDFEIFLWFLYFFCPMNWLLEFLELPHNFSIFLSHSHAPFKKSFLSGLFEVFQQAVGFLEENSEDYDFHMSTCAQNGDFHRFSLQIRSQLFLFLKFNL